VVAPADWEEVRLGEVLDYEQPTKYLVSSRDYVEGGRVPVLTAGKSFLLGHTDDLDGIYSDLPTIIFDDFTTATQWVDFDFKVKSSACKMLKAKRGTCDLRYVYERLRALNYRISDHKRHWISVFHTMEMRMPPLKEQEEIAEALSDADAAIESLECLIAKKRDVKQAAMQQLLTGRTRLPGFTGDWEAVSIGSFAECKAGGTPSTSIPAYWGGDIRWMSSGELNLKRVREVAGRITQSGLDNSSAQFFPADSVLIGLAGQGRTRGSAAINLVGLTTNQSIAAIFPSDCHDSKFFFYVMETKYKELRDLSDGGGGRGGLNLTIIKDVRVTVPQLDEQKKISEVLWSMDDELEALTEQMKKMRMVKEGMMQDLLTGKVRLL